MRIETQCRDGEVCSIPRSGERRLNLLRALCADWGMFNRLLMRGKMRTRRTTTPALFIAAPVIIAMMIAACAVLFALDQPWLGVRFSATASNGIKIISVDPKGPSAGLVVGSVVTALAAENGNRIELVPFDAVEDPDTAVNYAGFNTFLERQQIISAILRAPQVLVSFSDGSSHEISPGKHRPIASLPVDFWVLILVGLVGVLAGAWTLAFRREADAARIWALNGMALLLSTFPSAIFLTRELALDGADFRFLSTLNFVGSLSFCIFLFALFLVYPRRLVPPIIVGALVMLIPVLVLVDYLQFGVSGPDKGRYLPIAVFSIGSSVLAIIQYVMARGDPLKRAGVAWFGVSIALCTGIFTVLFVVPSFLGRSPSVPQWTGYALGLVVHCSLALGIFRYRLFDLEIWSFRILFYVAGTLIFAMLDILLVSVVAFDAVPAFGLALTAVVVLYLPLRSRLMARFAPPEMRRQELFTQVVDVAVAVVGAERNARWEALLRHAFDPLSLDRSPPVTEPEISEDGLGLLVPGRDVVAPMKLGYAYSGGRLFTRRETALAKELGDMLVYAIDSHNAFERGKAEERARIGRDMHDNIGAKLLSALHGTRPDSKDAMIRDALADLRDIINNVTGTPQSLDENLAELRLETAERLSAAGLALHWVSDADDGAPLSPVAAHALRSIVREGVSNSIRHANAKTVTVKIGHADERLDLTITDDGDCAAVGAQRDISTGSGLAGIRARLAALKGQLEIIDSGAGFTLKACFSSVQGRRT
ncbi:histidine kinase [Hoeflea sp. G2-23]|uniref:Histidine kinase n=1 Tax=Hoeflea algicola TaxID=2983763 RepID=A0ABT3Z7M4_9HYPH|nr:histidine kinase [Hoeflea algicola]MCY0147648.1 histidine kinase [Hoeflea algicola]